MPPPLFKLTLPSTLTLHQMPQWTHLSMLPPLLDQLFQTMSPKPWTNWTKLQIKWLPLMDPLIITSISLGINNTFAMELLPQEPPQWTPQRTTLIQIEPTSPTRHVQLTEPERLISPTQLLPPPLLPLMLSLPIKKPPQLKSRNEQVSTSYVRRTIDKLL